MKTKSGLLYIIPMSLGLSMITMCSVDKSNMACIKQPFKNVNVPFHDFVLNASEEKTIDLENGTSISIPANSFVDANGKMVSGEVNFQYREFHTAADIIASGIPMVYDSAGIKIQFESAGMFEINAKQGDKQVYIANGKNLQVSMASFKAGNNFNFYALDTLEKNWENIGSLSPTINQKKKKEIEALGACPTKPIEPKEYDGKTPLFDIDADYTGLTELQEFSGVVWQYAGTNGESDLTKNNWVYKHSWTSANIKPFDKDNGLYSLSLKGNKRDFTTIVSPVLKGKNFAEQMSRFQEKMESYGLVKEGREKEDSRLQAEGDLIRSFAVSNFGIYNWDRQYKEEDVIRLAADFDFGDKYKANEITVFLVINDGTVIKYPKYAWGEFSFKPSDKNRMIAVLPGNNVATFSVGEFKKINTDELKGQDKPHFTFKMQKENSKVASVEQLHKILSI